MLFGRNAQQIGALATAVTIGAAVFLGGSSQARAEGPVVATAKGTVGGGLLGAEVVCFTMAIIGVERGWPYFVFGAVGAAGGSVGGYFVESAGPAEASLYMLAGGMALVIPALVASLNATAYKPPEGVGDDPVTNEPADEPQTPDGIKTKKIISKLHPTTSGRRWRAPHIPLALFDVHEGAIVAGLPAIEVRPLFTEQERGMFGVEEGHEVRVPILRGTF